VRRLFRACGVAFLIVGMTVTISACQVLGQQSTAAKNAQGRIAWPKDGDLWVYDLATKQQTRITQLPQGAAVTGATWSPDGQRVVYAQFWRRPNDRSSGADLFIANKDGSEPRLFAERDAANSVLEAPEWLPSGRVYYDIRRVNNGRETQTIVRQIDAGQPETLMENGYSPAVSPDETTMAYIRSRGTGQQLLKKTIAESGDGCELVSDQVFQYLSQPRISPDGKRLALGGSGEPNLTAPSACGGDPRTHPSALGLNLVAWLAPAVAYAHGLPADVYSMNLDGSDLKRVADIKDDDPTVAYSPDGTKLAIFGVAALYVVDANGGPTNKLVDQGGYGGLDWTN
jgi:Tol biopolymer transport system component